MILKNLRNPFSSFTHFEKEMLHCGLVYFIVIALMNNADAHYLIPKGIFVGLCYIPCFYILKLVYYALIQCRPGVNNQECYQPGSDLVRLDTILNFIAAGIIVTMFFTGYLYAVLPKIASLMATIWKAFQKLFSL